VQRPQRPVLRQSFLPFALPVGVGATPLNTSNQQASLSGLYDSFTVSVPFGAANTVWMGDASINPASFNGFECPVGLPVMFSISNERQLYEVQAPLVDPLCAVPESIPFIAWDPSNIYFAALAPVTIGIILFQSVYI
jgi:hypothetical protein